MDDNREKKCSVLVLKRGTVVSSEGVEMPDGERIKEIEKNGYSYLGILEYNKIKESKMKENFRREWLSLMRYGAGVVKWITSELDEIDRKSWH